LWLVGVEVVILLVAVVEQVGSEQVQVLVLLLEQTTQLRLVVAGLERQRLTGKQKEPAEGIPHLALLLQMGEVRVVAAKTLECNREQMVVLVVVVQMAAVVEQATLQQRLPMVAMALHQPPVKEIMVVAEITLLQDSVGAAVAGLLTLG
jgi:hypothetical protein